MFCQDTGQLITGHNNGHQDKLIVFSGHPEPYPPPHPGWWRKTCCAWRPVGHTVPNKPGWGDLDGFEDGEDAGRRTMKTPWSKLHFVSPKNSSFFVCLILFVHFFQKTTFFPLICWNLTQLGDGQHMSTRPRCGQATTREDGVWKPRLST